MIWKNGEGYFDPTAGEALSTVIHEEKVKKKREKAKEKWEADKTGILSCDVYSEKPPALEPCFAYIPADRAGGGYPNCTALTDMCPGFDKCAFYKSVSRHKSDREQAYGLISRKPYKEQRIIALKYYLGKMPWTKEKRRKHDSKGISGPCVQDGSTLSQ